MTNITALIAIFLIVTALILQFKSSRGLRNSPWGEALARRYHLDTPLSALITIISLALMFYWIKHMLQRPFQDMLFYLSGALMLNAAILGRIGLLTYLSDQQNESD